MLELPQGGEVYRVLGIDPGTDTLGVSVLDINLVNCKISLVYVNTLSANSLLNKYPLISENYGDRFTKLKIHSNELANLFNYFQPHCVISESPYMGRFAQAFEALTECLSMIRQTVFQYNPYIGLELVDPPSVKKAVGAKGKGSDKEAVKESLRANAEIMGLDNELINSLDEHSVDAIAVAYFKLNFVSHHLKLEGFSYA